MKWIIGAASGAALIVGGWMVQQGQDADSAASSQPTPPPSHPDCQDQDGDGFGLGCAAGRDCNDQDASIHPARGESCNFRDDDCNGLVDDAPSCSAPSLDRSPVTVPSGRFLMGSEVAAADERPSHRVEVSALTLDRHEVTNERFAECVAAGACRAPTLGSSRLRQEYYDAPQFADYPVIFVNWYQARDFCKFAGGRLPTEAEWEKAARGSELAARTYPWGNEPPTCALANLGGPQSCVGDTDRVGRRLLGSSPYGALDMAGNVWEWVGDWYDPKYYEKSPARDPRGPATGRLKVMRGGCWMSGADSLRVSCRKAELPATWAHNVGFRCAYPEGK